MILLIILLVLIQLKDLQIMFKQSLRSSITIYLFLLGPLTSIVSDVMANTKSISVPQLINENNIKFEDIPQIISDNNLELKSLKN